MARAHWRCRCSSFLFDRSNKVARISTSTWSQRRPKAVACAGTREAAPLNSWVKTAHWAEAAVSIASTKTSMPALSSAGNQHVSMNTRCPLTIYGSNKKEEQRHRQWARATRQAFSPIALPGGYPNFLVAEDADRVAKSYGANAERLIAAKRRYDPDNVFRSAIPLPAADAGPPDPALSRPALYPAIGRSSSRAAGKRCRTRS